MPAWPASSAESRCRDSPIFRALTSNFNAKERALALREFAHKPGTVIRRRKHYSVLTRAHARRCVTRRVYYIENKRALNLFVERRRRREVIPVARHC